MDGMADTVEFKLNIACYEGDSMALRLTFHEY